MSHAVNVVELQALSDHPRIAEADERLAMLGQQRADAEVDLRLLQQKREREEAEAALRLHTGSKIPPAIKKQLYVGMELTVHTAQLCWVLDAAIERVTAARDALLGEVRAEVLAQLHEQRRNAIVDLDRALSVAAEANERVVSIQDALSRLGRQVLGSGTANSAGIGTRTGAAVIRADPLPDLAWWELSLRTTRTQPETRLSVWRDHVSRVLGIKLGGSGEG